LERLFDDLALKSGLIAQRLEEGTVLLEGPGVFVHADGKMKSEYCSCCFSIWAATPARAEEIGAQLFHVVGERRILDQMFILDWHFATGRDGISSTSFEEIACEVLHDEAYPDLGEPVMDFITRYLDGQETVLILLGSPGTLHTRSLTPTEGSRLIARLCGGDLAREQLAFARTFPLGTKTCSVASIYRACGTVSN
jgi:hypothetical protein